MTTFDVKALVDYHIWISKPKFSKDPSVRRRRRHCCSSSVQCAGLRSEAVADFDKEEPLLLLQKKHSAP